MEYNISDLGIMVAIVSFLGFLVENIWLAITKGYIDNRNMNAPFLLGYGLMFLFLLFSLGIPASLVQWGILKKSNSKRIQYIVYFICSFVAVCIGEIILGTIVEKLCCIEYWNYSKIPLHITKYTSIPTSIGFAAMITFFMGKCVTPLMSWIGRLDSVWIRVLSAVLMIVMVLDFFHSFHHMILLKDFYRRWEIEISDLKNWKKKLKIYYGR